VGYSTFRYDTHYYGFFQHCSGTAACRRYDGGSRFITVFQLYLTKTARKAESEFAHVYKWKFLNMHPDLPPGKWLLLTLTLGVGGSLLAIAHI
jgi:hypothetical protein